MTKKDKKYSDILPGWMARAIDMYVDGFKSMTVGKWLWAMIAVKLILLFLVMKLLFFPNLLKENYSTDAERADAVRQNLTESVLKRGPAPSDQ